jgi:uracil-DNA glycosylase
MPATHFDRSTFRRATPFIQRNLRVPGEGPDGKVRCMLIGEKPGRDESHRGRPFIGISGKYLDIFLNVANIDRRSLYITNLVKEFTEYSKPTAEEISRDHAELVDEITAHDPDIIGLVGGWAVENVLCTVKADMDRTHGVARVVPSLFGDELYRSGDRKWTIIPLYHPANCVHRPDTAAQVLDDFLSLGKLIDRESDVLPDDAYANREHYQDFYGDEKTVYDVAGCDTEGSIEHPWCATISTEPGTGLLFKPGQGINFRNKVYMHHSLHDRPILRNGMGIDLDGVEVVDTMVLSFALTITPQGLKSLLYRFCNMEQDDYSDLMAEADRDKATDYLCSVLDHEWPPIEPFIVFEAGKPRIKKPWPINKRVLKIITDVAEDKRDKDGNPTDPRKRWADIDDFVREPVEELLGPMTVATLDDVPYEKAQYYAVRDADGTRRLGPILEQKVHDMELDRIVKIDHDVLEMFDRMQEVGIALAPARFWDDLADRCDTQMDRAK